MKVIKIDGEIWVVTANEFISELEASTGDVEVFVSSPGGSVFQGVKMGNAIAAYDRGEVTVTITSLAASIASYLVTKADKVRAYDNATYMIHNAIAPTYGDYRVHDKQSAILKGLTGIIANGYVEKTGKSKDEIERMMDEETFFFGAEMKDAGFVDEIIATDSDKDAAASLALAHESVKACMKNSIENVQEDESTEAAAMLKTMEESTPVSKEDISDGGGAENALKVNALHARLKLKEKEITL